MSKTTKIETYNMNENETVGTCAFSINSAIVRLSQIGFSHNSIFTMKKRIDGVAASLWSLFVTVVEDKTPEIAETRKFLDDQLQQRLDELANLFTEMENTPR